NSPRHPPSTFFPYTTLFRSFAGILRRSLRPSDLCARYGGEEFVAILVDADSNTAMEIAENIRRNAAAARPHSAAGEPLNYTVSIDRKSTRLNSSHVKISYAV